MESPTAAVLARASALLKPASQLISITLSSGEMLDEVVIAASRKAEKISDDLNKFIVDSDKYVITYQNDEDYVDAYDALYDELLEEVEVYS